jgi:RNA polymerase sigma-70 factor (ECF subfamily)
MTATTRVATLASTDSFEEFYRTEVDGLYRALSLALGSADLASEAVDEAMTRAFQRWPKVREFHNPAGWVYRVGLNWSISRLRKRNRERLGEDWLLDEPGRQDLGFDPDLYRALARLPVESRSVVVLRHVLGWSTAETAAALGVSQGTLKSKLFRALSQLRREMEQQ